MIEKPTTIAGYTTEDTVRVRRTCLHLATVLGDFINEIVIIGGLVPTLLIPEEEIPEGVDGYSGTKDLDIGLSLAVFEEKRYEAIAERLRGAGFTQHRNERGNPTHQTWHMTEGAGATFDFLIAPSAKSDSPGKLKHLEHDFAAVITPGLPLAFRDYEKIRLSGSSLYGEQVEREVLVAGPGAFIVLKALALATRAKFKDAYDLAFILENYPQGTSEIARRFLPLLDTDEAVRAIEILDADFTDPAHLGPVRTAMFLYGRPDIETQTDAAGYVRRFLRTLEQIRSGSGRDSAQ